MKQLLPIIVILICSNCDIDNRKLLIVNNTNDTIYYELQIDTMMKYDLYLQEILPSDSFRPLFAKGGEGAWEYKINRLSPDSTLHIYFFNSDDITNSINSGGYKRMSLKVKDLDSLNWNIEFNEF